MLSIKQRIAAEERLTDLNNIAFYLRIGEDRPTSDPTHVPLYQDGPGSSPEQAIGLVVPAGSVPKGPKRINSESQLAKDLSRSQSLTPITIVSGAWRIQEDTGYSKCVGVLLVTMTSPTTFIGKGIITELADSSSSEWRGFSYPYNLEDGTIHDNGQVSWLSNSPQIGGKWKTLATPSSDGLILSGPFTVVSGNAAPGNGTYTHVLPDP